MELMMMMVVMMMDDRRVECFLFFARQQNKSFQNFLFGHNISIASMGRLHIQPHLP